MNLKGVIMKSLLLTITLFVSANAFADRDCTSTISAFTKQYTGHGRTEMQAKVNARVLCAQENDKMFCDMTTASCNEQPDERGAYCEFAPFSKLYYAFGWTVEHARQRAAQECLRSESQIFCGPEKATCYDLR